MMPPFVMNPEIATAVIGGASGLLGGVIVALATLRATKLAFKHSLDSETKNRRAVVGGVQLGIKTEMEVLWEIYEKELEGDPLKEWHILPENYFTVYESNCSYIGQIEEDDLRTAIITTYLLAKSLLNAHLHNNALHERCKQLANNAVELAKAQKEKEDYQRVSLIPLRQRARESFLNCLKLFPSSQSIN